MECKLQKENILNDDEPLLILPMKDLDFVPKDLLKKNISIRSEIRESRRYKINTFNILEHLDKKESLGETKITERDSLENIVLNKGSKKAMQLLNESLLNQLFKDTKLPTEDIILIYRIYFQMINHPYSLIAKSDIGQFWEKCKSYFSTKQYGKTGDILLSMTNQKKIDFSKNNEYQIYSKRKL